MDLSDIKNSKKVFDAVWTYNLCATEIDKISWEKVEVLLNNLLDTIINQKSTITEQQVKDLFAQTVSELEKILDISPLDECGIYEYGGLNYLFADIMKSLSFPVKLGKYALISDFVYGEDFEE